MDTTPERETVPEQAAPTAQPEVVMNEGEVPSIVASPVGVPSAVPNKLWYKKNQLLVSLLLAGLILLGAGYYVYVTNYSQGATVAIVNGSKIHQQALDESIKLIEETAKQQGMDVTLEENKTEIKNQALEVLVNNTLLITAATQAGMEITESDIQAKYAELTTQLGGEEALKTKIAEVGLTEKKLLSNIKERLLADKYIEAETDIENLVVSDEEVSAFLKGIDTGATELPPLDQIRPQIEAQILSQKQQQIVTDLLAKLRSEATIDIKI